VVFWSLSAVGALSLVALDGSQLQQERSRREEIAEAPISKDGYVKLPSGEMYETAAIRFDLHDLSGIWGSFPGGWESFGPDVPPMTVEGREVLAKRFSADRVSNPLLANDPQYKCAPQGFPRLWFDQELIENIHLNDKLLQLSQWEQTLREIWMDGRKLPTPADLAELGPQYYGYSVGRWQGDTLIVDTVGLDDRNWIDDDNGYPLSSEARIQERYKRLNADAIAVQFVLYDPKYYATPWVGDVKPWRRMPRSTVTNSGWFGLYSGATEAVCAPMNERAYHDGSARAYERQEPQR
jgi:hypothetical protein